MKDDADMKALRAKAAASMKELSDKHPDAGGQAFVRRGKDVHLIGPDGEIDDQPAEFDAKENAYKPKAAKVLKAKTRPERLRAAAADETDQKLKARMLKQAEKLESLDPPDEDVTN